MLPPDMAIFDLRRPTCALVTNGMRDINTQNMPEGSWFLSTPRLLSTYPEVEDSRGGVGIVGLLRRLRDAIRTMATNVSRSRKGRRRRRSCGRNTIRVVQLDFTP